MELQMLVSEYEHTIHYDNAFPMNTKKCDFLLHDAMLVQYMLSSCVHPSVCPSQAGIVPKRLNIGSRKQRHTIAQGL